MITDMNDRNASASTVLVVKALVGYPAVKSLVAAPDPIVLGNSTTFTTTVTGGTGPYSYSYGNLPAGCSSSNAATLPCRPTVTGNFTVSVKVSDANNRSATGSTLLAVEAAPTPLSIQSFTASPNPVSVGASTTLSVAVTGGTSPYSYTYSGLPTGCSTSNTASLSCTPSVKGNFTVKVSVTDQATHSASSSLTLTVKPGGINTPVPLQVTAGANITKTYVGWAVALSANATGGTPQYSYVWSLNGTNTTVTKYAWSETFSHAGNYTYSVWAKDSEGNIARSKAFTVEVLPATSAPPNPGSTSNPTGLSGAIGSWLWLLLVAALIAAVIIVAIWYRRRRHPEETAAEPAAEAPAAAVGTPVAAEWDESTEE
jgi:hypothetical protein